MPTFWLTFDMTELTWDDQESWLSTITPRKRISVTTFAGVPQSRMGGVLGKWLLFLADGQMSKAADFSSWMGRPRSTNSSFMMLRAAQTVFEACSAEVSEWYRRESCRLQMNGGNCCSPLPYCANQTSKCRTEHYSSIFARHTTMPIKRLGRKRERGVLAINKLNYRN